MILCNLYETTFDELLKLKALAEKSRDMEMSNLQRAIVKAFGE